MHVTGEQQASIIFNGTLKACICADQSCLLVVVTIHDEPSSHCHTDKGIKPKQRHGQNALPLCMIDCFQSTNALRHDCPTPVTFFEHQNGQSCLTRIPLCRLAETWRRLLFASWVAIALLPMAVVRPVSRSPSEAVALMVPPSPL